MKVRAVNPLDQPRPFELAEMFFSTTNAKGVITSGNSVFVRVSGFSPEELIGEPHNLIRHPDMPRAVFRLLWSTIAAGKPIVAYVKNMAKDGRYYWVVALVMPLRDGFLSVRFKPSSPLLAQVEQLYRAMREAEQAQGDGGEAGRAGMDAAEEILHRALSELGFPDYGAFMRLLMRTEMQCREQALQKAGRNREAPPNAAKAAHAAGLQMILAEGQRAGEQIDRLYQRLDELAGFGKSLVEKCSTVTELTRDIRFSALSTSIKAAKLGEEGNSLGIVAGFLSESSQRTANEVGVLKERVGGIGAELSEMGFHLSASRLQVEMMQSFCRELLAGMVSAAGTGTSQAKMIGDLEHVFRESTTGMARTLEGLGRRLHELEGAGEDIRRTMLTLQFAQVCGLVETSRVQGDSTIADVFSEVRGHIAKSSEQLAELNRIAASFSAQIREAPKIAREIKAAISRIDEGLAELESEAGPVAAGKAPR